MIVINNAVGVYIEDISLLNSPNHNIEIVNCTLVRVRSLHVVAPHLSPNTDGINFYGGHDQLLESSIISNGDDCVSVVPVGENTDACVLGDPRQEACRGGNVVVRNVTCVGGHGVAVGGVQHGTVSNVTFTNITALGNGSITEDKYASGGMRIKSYPNSSGEVYDILYDNIYVQDVYLPIQLLHDYCPWPCTEPRNNRSVYFHDITFQNIHGSGRRSQQGDFDCSPGVPCNRILVKDIRLGRADAHFDCSHASVQFSGTNLPSACRAVD